MTPDLRLVRAQWSEERQIYSTLCDHVVGVLKVGCREAGVFAWVDGRTKGTTSLLKKIMTKSVDYNDVSDKAGARIVVRFREQLKPVEQVVERCFRIVTREDKTEKLGNNRVGYQAVHYDVTVNDAEPLELQDRLCEIQVRTLCQNLWAELDHQLSYKPATAIAEDISRQINLLNGLLELADRQFSIINETIRSCGGPVPELQLFLEGIYYSLAAGPYDPKLTADVIETLLPLYGGSATSRIAAEIGAFVEEHRGTLLLIYGEYGDIEDPPLFLNQPELYMILHLLDKDMFRIEEQWCSQYPREELQRVATMWGTPLD
jgi:ppGpp synthetase/RelA/SpoT-type nucleotidyltranferase